VSGHIETAAGGGESAYGNSLEIRGTLYHARSNHRPTCHLATSSECRQIAMVASAASSDTTSLTHRIVSTTLDRSRPASERATCISACLRLLKNASALTSLSVRTWNLPCRAPISDLLGRASGRPYQRARARARARAVLHREPARRVSRLQNWRCDDRHACDFARFGFFRQSQSRS
jgi:hypothetical protein